MSSHLHEQCNATIEEYRQWIEKKLDSWARMDSPKAFQAMEREMAALSRQMSDALTSAVLLERLAAPEFQARASASARGSGRYRSGGRRSVGVRLLGGSTVRVQAEYLKPERRGRRGRPRRSGKRGKGGQGLYPALVALGIVFGASPALATEVCCQIADSDSLRAGLASLSRRGIDMGHKPTQRLVNRVGQQARHESHEWLKQEDKHESRVLAGKRVVVAVDGGRLRERQPHRRGRRRKNGRRGFKVPWREPKMLVIYTIDDKGEVENEFRPVYDGTLGDCDQVFDMVGSYLEALGARDARELIVVGDGAEWLWNRTDGLRERLGLRPEQVSEVIDWYHAVEVLHHISTIPAKWEAKARARWVKKAKKQLACGDIDGLVQLIETLAKGRRSKLVRKHIGYFTRNRHRMQYSAFKQACVPRGSGAVESMIRRVVNLRLKGNARFWLKENAESMLLLRSYLKANRIDDLLGWFYARVASWWPPAVAAAPAAPVTP